MAKDAPKPMSIVKRTYLVGYNAVSALLWSVVFYRTVLVLATTQSPELVYPAVGEWTKWTQTVAGLEIVHSVLGSLKIVLLFLTLPSPSLHSITAHPPPHPPKKRKRQTVPV